MTASRAGSGRFDYRPLPVAVSFGSGAARDTLEEQLDRLDLGRIMVVVSRSASRVLDSIAGPIGDRVVSTFAESAQHVPVEVADAARSLAQQSEADGLVVVGGGSAIGAAKAVARVTSLPIVAIPTTYSGSETTPMWGLTSEGHKRTGIDRAVLPRVVIYDADLTRTMPVDLAVVSGFNALAHALESFWAPGANPVTALHAQEAVGALTSGLRAIRAGVAVTADYERALFGAYLAGTSFAVAGSGLHHKLCHMLGGSFDLPHAPTHAIVLPHVVAVAAASVEIPSGVAAAFGDSDLAAGLRAFAGEVGAPTRLRDIGLSRAGLREAIATAAALPAIPHPRPVTAQTVAEILTAAY